MDHLNNLYSTSAYLLPGATFIIGLMGSLHCVGMCGGLVMSCTPQRKNNYFYQLGRLLSYLLLAALAGFLGSYLSMTTDNTTLSLVSGILIGLLLIWLGLKQILKNNARIKLPSFLNKYIFKLWGKVMPKDSKNVSLGTSFIIGSFSILLPCGLLYGVVLTLTAFDSPLLSMLCIFTFWVGTLPVMSFAPDIIKRLIKPLYEKMPLITSSFLILIGLLTIANRVYDSFYGIQNCH